MDGPSTFDELPLSPAITGVVAALGYEEPTPIQAAAIAPLVAGRDLLGQAATGTGKTAAFALPMLELLTEGDRAGADAPLGLILVPTRELAMQVSEAVHRYGRNLAARVVPVYGGQPIGRQLHALARGVDVVVATPGRAVDHIGRGTLRLDGVRMVVLDEADEMLDMGFADDLDAVLDVVPGTSQTVLFSATMPRRIETLARKRLTDPVSIRIETRPSAAEAARVEQRGYVVARAHKAAALGRILDVESPDAAIVFCRTRTEVDQLTELLNGRGYRAEALHGGMNQEARDRVMGRVRNGTADLLIATDVAARGLDIDLLTHVVNYDVPSAPESYVHRIGRVGRAGREGVAITLVEPREHRQLADIQRATSDAIRIEKIPSVADVNERRMGQTIDALRSAMEDSDELDHYRAVIDELSAEADLFDIALAAVRLAHESAGTVEDEQEIPEVELRRDRPDRRNERVDRGPGRPTRSDRGQRDGGRRDGDRRDAGRRGRSGGRDMTRLYFPIGRSSRVGPGDLVGAIAGETRLSGNDIGSIEVTDRFSLVEVPTESVDEVLGAMARTTIRGRRAAPRRERFERR